VVAEPRGAGRSGRARGPPRAPVSLAGRGLDGPSPPPRVPPADGGLARAGRAHGVHQPAAREDRPLREGARGHRAGEAALLRHRRRPGRVRHRRAGREPHGAADQSRGQPRAPGQPGRDRRRRTGLGADALRPRPLADPHLPGRHPPVGRLPGDAPLGPRGAACAAGCRAPHPDRDRHLAHPREPARRDPARSPRGALAPVGAGEPRHGARRGAARLRRLRRHAIPRLTCATCASSPPAAGPASAG